MKTESLKIIPEYSKEEFLRKAWISLAKEDVPLDVFALDFSNIETNYYTVVRGKANYLAEWTAEIGYFRTEHYTEYETYKEQIPYEVTEKEYNSIKQEYQYVKKTKYRTEERTRPVAKTRRVTDWKGQSNGKHSDMVDNFACIDNGNFDSVRYYNDCNTIKNNSIEFLSQEEINQNPNSIITDKTVDFIVSKHKKKIFSQVYLAVPGDEKKGVDYQILSYDQTLIQTILVPEYTATIEYKGETYAVSAFPFGTMSFTEANIPNKKSADEVKKEKHEAMLQANQERKDSFKEVSLNRNFVFYVASFVLLLVSIIVSFTAKHYAPVIVCFVLAIVMYIFTYFFTAKINDKLKKEIEQANEEAKKQCEEECNAYAVTRKKEILDDLNKKLNMLGFAPASNDEYAVE